MKKIGTFFYDIKINGHEKCVGKQTTYQHYLIHYKINISISLINSKYKSGQWAL